MRSYEITTKTYGCLADDPIIRYPQGEYEEREPIELFTDRIIAGG
jgi:hypothetical protein